MFLPLFADAPLAAHAARLSQDLDWNAIDIARDPLKCFSNRHAQPLVCLYALIVGEALREQQINPALVAGYSVGELAAYGIAGALSARDVIEAASARAKAMDDCAPADSGMLAVRGVRRVELEARAAAKGLDVAIRNGDDHAVLAGPRDRLAALAAELGKQGSVHVVSLPISVPAHSPILQAAVETFGSTLRKLHWQRTAVAVIAGINANIVRDPLRAIDTLSRQVASTIEWARVMDVAVEMGTSVFFEVGPGNALSRMILERHPQTPARSLTDFSSLSGAVTWLRHHTD
jgi:[acyl-carrier-protein] S-malonyltransferase